MKIQNPLLSDLNNVQKTSGSGESRRKAERRAAGGGEDRVELSNAGEQLSGLRAALVDASDVRMEKVERIKAEIESGRYHPDAGQIADAMVRDALQYSKWGLT